MSLHNPYWNEIKDSVSRHIDPLYKTRMVGRVDDMGNWWRLRNRLARVYSWTVTAPETVAFIAHYSRGNLIDPMAGTGYWSYLLGQAGVDCVSSDRDPPYEALDINQWHVHASQHVEVAKLDAVAAIDQSDARRTLLLSWPPMDDTACRALQVYAGERIIYIGEGMDGCTADDQFFVELLKGWTMVAEHAPVQYWGIHDYITVFDRNR